MIIDRGIDRHMEIGKALRKTYKLRVATIGAKSIEVTFPYEVVEREARSEGLTIEEFIRKFQAIAHYDSFDGVLYTFERIEQ